jgi:hypothetical protein
MAGSCEIVIDRQGNVEMKAQGFKGKACEQFTKEIEDALGTVTDRKKTYESSMVDKTGAKQSVTR